MSVVATRYWQDTTLQKYCLELGHFCALKRKFVGLFFFFFANLRCQQIVFGSGHCCAHLGKPEMSETFSFYHGGLKVKMVRARANTKENTGKGDRNARGKGSQN